MFVLEAYKTYWRLTNVLEMSPYKILVLKVTEFVPQTVAASDVGPEESGEWAVFMVRSGDCHDGSQLTTTAEEIADREIELWKMRSVPLSKTDDPLLYWRCPTSPRPLRPFTYNPSVVWAHPLQLPTSLRPLLCTSTVTT